MIYTFFSTVEGFVESYSSTNYTQARNGTGTLFSLQTQPVVGQLASYVAKYSETDWFYYEGFASFDTSTINTADTISKVALFASDSNPNMLQTVEAYAYDWGTAISNSTFVSPSVIATLPPKVASTTGASATERQFSENGTNFQTSINKTGLTKLLFISSDQRLGTNQPANTNSGETATLGGPKLTIQTTNASETTYTVYLDTSNIGTINAHSTSMTSNYANANIDWPTTQAGSSSIVKTSNSNTAFTMGTYTVAIYSGKSVAYYAYQISEALYSFDTSAVPTNVIVKEATMTAYAVGGISSNHAGALEVYATSFPSPLGVAEGNSATSLWTNPATLNPSNVLLSASADYWPSGSNNMVQLDPTAAFASAIVKGGITKLLMINSSERQSFASNGQFYGAGDDGSSARTFLTIITTAAVSPTHNLGALGVG